MRSETGIWDFFYFVFSFGCCCLKSFKYSYIIDIGGYCRLSVSYAIEFGSVAFLSVFLSHSLADFVSFEFSNGIEGFESDLGLNEIRLCTYFFYLFICHAIGIFDKRIISRNKIENVFYQSNLLVVHCTRMFLLLVCRWFYGNSHLWLRLWNVKVPNMAFHPF